MGLEEGGEGMKVKPGRQQALFAPKKGAACRFMRCFGSLYFPRRWRNLRHVTPVGFICVFICVCRLMQPVFLFSHFCTARVSSKANLLLSSTEHALPWWGNIHPHPHSSFPKPISSTTGLEERGLDHPGMGSQRGALMWHKHMCRARIQSLQKHTHKTVLLPPVQHHYSSSLEQWDARKESEGVAAAFCARLKNWSRMVTLREGKPAWSNHISINQLSSKVNRGLIRQNSAELLF